MNTAHKFETNQKQSTQPKRTISGTQFKAVQKAVAAVINDSIPESSVHAVTKAAVYGIKVGQRSELMLQVESEKILDPRHVEVRMVDGAGRRYVWFGTTGQAARLKPGQVVVLKATAIQQGNAGMEIKHCRVVETSE
jgi:ribosomal protein L16/L10AE